MCSENRNICYSIKGTATDGFVCVVYFAELELDFIRVSLLSFAEDTANLLISRGLPRFSLFVYICVTVLREPLTFIHRRTQCTGSQDLPGLGYGPPKGVVWPLRAGKAIAGG